jgi:hypothetical protein
MEKDNKNQNEKNFGFFGPFQLFKEKLGRKSKKKTLLNLRAGLSSNFFMPRSLTAVGLGFLILARFYQAIVHLPVEKFHDL